MTEWPLDVTAPRIRYSMAKCCRYGDRSNSFMLMKEAPHAKENLEDQHRMLGLIDLIDART